jgi:hypothetical protein
MEKSPRRRVIGSHWAALLSVVCSWPVLVATRLWFLGDATHGSADVHALSH